MYGGQTSPSVRGTGVRKGLGGGARIKVAVRVRPMLGHELNQGHDSTKVQINGEN